MVITTPEDVAVTLDAITALPVPPAGTLLLLMVEAKAAAIAVPPKEPA
jgi:hypothetical protein